jgi:hypothetical protein
MDHMRFFQCVFCAALAVPLSLGHASENDVHGPPGPWAHDLVLCEAQLSEGPLTAFAEYFVREFAHRPLVFDWFASPSMKAMESAGLMGISPDRLHNLVLFLDPNESGDKVELTIGELTRMSWRPLIRREFTEDPSLWLPMRLKSDEITQGYEYLMARAQAQIAGSGIRPQIAASGIKAQQLGLSLPLPDGNRLVLEFHADRGLLVSMGLDVPCELYEQYSGEVELETTFVVTPGQTYCRVDLMHFHTNKKNAGPPGGVL